MRLIPRADTRLATALPKARSNERAEDTISTIAVTEHSPASMGRERNEKRPVGQSAFLQLQGNCLAEPITSHYRLRG
jgi:hypothetical protein